jgi:phosphoribosylformylglycinamidine cyclo-ligase
MGSSGLHSNGYSLVRHVFFQRAGWSLDREVPELGGTLGEVLLTPTRVYAKHCLELIQELNGDDEKPLHAMSHITGGGFAANLARVIPAELSVRIDRATWTPAPIFDLVGQLGEVALPELEKTINMGAGMVAVLDPAAADQAIAALQARDIPAWVCGEVTSTPGGTVTLEGSYAK